MKPVGAAAIHQVCNPVKPFVNTFRIWPGLELDWSFPANRVNLVWDPLHNFKTKLGKKKRKDKSPDW